MYKEIDDINNCEYEDVDLFTEKEEIIEFDEENTSIDFYWDRVEDFIDEIKTKEDSVVSKEKVEDFCFKYKLSDLVKEDVYAALEENQIEVISDEREWTFKSTADIGVDYDSMSAGQIYYKEVSQYKLLSVKEEREYLEKYIRENDMWAREQLICCNLRLVLDIARKYYKKNPSVEISDLISVGNLGLITAIDRFTLDKENKLSTYATWWIKAYMEDYLAGALRAFRVSVGTNKKIGRIFYHRNDLTIKNNKEPSLEELAKACEMPVEEVSGLLTIALPTKSLDAELNEDGLTLGDLIGQEDKNDDEEKELRKKDALLKVIFTTFDEREQKILINRYGLNNNEDKLTLKEIGDSLGITSERTRQIETRALMKLRHPINVKKLNGAEV